MQRSPTRQQIAITFMIGAVIATMVLGGAVAYELGRGDRTVRVVGGTSAGAARTNNDLSAPSGADAGSAQGTPAADVTAGAAGGAGGAGAGGPAHPGGGGGAARH